MGRPWLLLMTCTPPQPPLTMPRCHGAGVSAWWCTQVVEGSGHARARVPLWSGTSRLPGTRVPVSPMHLWLLVQVASMQQITAPMPAGGGAGPKGSQGYAQGGQPTRVPELVGPPGFRGLGFPPPGTLQGTPGSLQVWSGQPSAHSREHPRFHLAMELVCHPACPRNQQATQEPEFLPKMLKILAHLNSVFRDPKPIKTSHY